MRRGLSPLTVDAEFHTYVVFLRFFKGCNLILRKESRSDFSEGIFTAISGGMIYE